MKGKSFVLVAAALAISTPAAAGEISGNGSPVPGGVNGASACSYSGLNDTPEDGTGLLQTFAVFMKLLGITPGSPIHPGQACRGN